MVKVGNNKQFKLLIWLLITVIISLPTLAVSWNSPFNGQGNPSFEHDLTSDFSNGTTIINLPFATPFTPLITDINSDGDNEILLISATGIITVLDKNLNILQQEIKSIAFDYQPIMFGTNIVTKNKNTTYVYNSTLGLINEFNVSMNITNFYQAQCTDDFCYSVYDLNSTITRMSKFNTTSHQYVNLTTYLGVANNSQSYYDFIPAIDANNVRMYFICDADRDTLFGVCSVNLALSVNTIWSGDGILDDLNVDSAEGNLYVAGQISSPIVFNVDGGLEEIAFSYIGCSGTSGFVNTDYHLDWRTVDSTVFASRTINLLRLRADCSASTHFSYPTLTTYAEDINLCGIASGQSGSVPLVTDQGLFCTDTSNIPLTTNFIPNNLDTNNVRQGFALLSSDFDGDPVDGTGLNKEDEFFYYGGFFDNSKTSLDVSLGTNFTSSPMVALGNLDSSFTSIITSNTTTTRIIKTNIADNPPIVDNEFKHFGGYGSSDLGVNNPVVCINSSINFNTRECSLIPCSMGGYENDNDLNTERIVTNCGFDNTGNPTNAYENNLVNGTFNLNNPQFSCFYNTTGTFGVRLFLQDDINPSDFTEFNTQTIAVNVIDGTAGITCNILNPIDSGELDVSPTIAGQDDVISSFDMIFNIFTGGNSSIKLLVGLMMVLGLSLSVFMVTKSFAMSSISFVVGVWVAAIFTLFPLWIPIIITLVILGIGLMIFKGNFAQD